MCLRFCNGTPILTLARYLFAAVGGFWLLIGVLTAILTDRNIGPPMIFVSQRTDTALYGGPPQQILDEMPELRILRHTTVKGALAGFLVASGLLTVAVAWFGLREPEVWALTTLTIVGFAVLPYWWIALGPYRNSGINLALGDIPPFMWVPAIIMPAASILGWLNYLRS